MRLEGVRWVASAMPQLKREPRDWQFMIYLKSGEIIREPDGDRFAPGSLMVAPEKEILGLSKSGRSLRTVDSTTEGLALRLNPEDLLLSVTTTSPVKAQPEVVQVARKAIERLSEEACTDEIVEDQLSSVLKACCAARLVHSEALRRLHGSGNPRAQRTQDAMFQTVQSLAKQPMLVDATERAGLTERQVRREVKQLQEEYDLLDRGFRETVRRWRLTTAVLLLSARHLAINDVASAVGYSSATALGRAFKQAGMPSPSKVRRSMG